MRKDKHLISDIAIIAAAGAVAVSWFMRDDDEERTAPKSSEAQSTAAPTHGIRDLETRLAAVERQNAECFASLEVRLNEHDQKLAQLPSTQQIIAAMEQLLNRTTASLEQRLSSQSQAIDLLKSAVATTDSLLERTMEFTKQTFAQRLDNAESK